jgi:spore coat protein CotH
MDFDQNEEFRGGGGFKALAFRKTPSYVKITMALTIKA